LYIGATVAPFNQNYTESESIHSLNICKPKVIFCSKAVCRKFINLKNNKLNYIEKIILIDSDEEFPDVETLDTFIFKTLKDHKIPALILAPPLVVLLAKNPLVENYDLSCVKNIFSGAAPLAKDTEENVKKRLNIPAIWQGYSLTETTFGVTMMAVGESKDGSVGKVVTYMSCKVRDPDSGKSLGPGVAPAELEAILLGNPKIKDVGVVGVPNEEAGELPLAFVVKNEGVDLTEKEVIDFVAERVSPQKRLRGGVIFVSAIPKNSSGKILRRELRNM
ncbi:AMP-binding domain containing protein, partial [Asbolus verrucosus]